MASNMVRTRFPSVPRVSLAALLVGGVMALSAPAAQAQTGQLTGAVTNTSSGAAIGQVQVFLVGENLGALSRADGRYLILNVRPGTYELSAQRIGFGTETQTVTVTAGGTTTTNFTLGVRALGLDAPFR